MKTKRAYYRCPILAALAAGYHGVKFEDRDGGVLERCLLDEDMGWYNWDGERYLDHIWYYSQESMHLLEPQDSDWWQCEIDFDNPTECSTQKDIQFLSGWDLKAIRNDDESGLLWDKLSLRNNMPFPWPEFEEVE